METQELVSRIEQLSAPAQRLVIELVELLGQHATPIVPAPAAAEPSGATILPPLDLTGVPTTWPENQFMDPEFYGMWADREDMKDGGAAYIHAVRRGLRPPR